MGRLFDVLGEMSESDRHVLMRQALRAKHLRFLLDQKAVGGEAGIVSPKCMAESRQ
jgi:hypothetical protein